MTFRLPARLALGVAVVATACGAVIGSQATGSDANQATTVDLRSKADQRLTGVREAKVAAAGDVNGDGRPDMIVGDPTAGHNRRSVSGSAYVVFGAPSAAPVGLDVLGDRGFRIDGAAAGDRAGFSVASAGDMNGDGLADLIVGAPEADMNGRRRSGSAYVVFGRASTTAIDLASLGDGGFRIDGAPVAGLSGHRLGWSVAGAGDVNGDGRADVVAGAPEAANTGHMGSGSAYVVFGTASTATIDLAALGAAGFRIDGAARGAFTGQSVAGAGDQNGDGRSDVIVNGAGSAHVVFGKASTETVALATLGSGGFHIAGAGAGVSVANAGDVNGDSRTDLVIGRTGSAYVLFGSESPGTIDVRALGADGFAIAAPAGGDGSGDDFGFAVSGAGDVNGDGRADVMVGARQSGYNGRFRSGSAYVVFGKATSETVDTGSLGHGGFRIDGAADYDWAGFSLAGPGDVNGDGRPDLLVGALRSAYVLTDRASSSLSTSAGARDTRFALSASGYAPGETIDILFDGATLLTAVADGAGSAAAVLRVPPGAALGVHPVTVQGRSSGLSTEVPFHVAPPPRVELSPASGYPDSPFEVRGSGFATPSERLAILFDGAPLGFATAGADGSVSQQGLRIPRAANPGEHRVEVLGETSGARADAVFRVTMPVWAQFHFLASRSGYNRFETILGPASVAGLEQRCRGVTDGPVGQASPVISKSRAYLTSEAGAVHAFDASTCARTWTARIGPGAPSSPALAGGRLFVGSAEGRLHALRETTGAPIWSSLADGFAAPPLVAEGRVYAGARDGSVYAFDAATGATVWEAAAGSPVDASVALGGGVLFAGTRAGTLRALDAATGAAIWVRATAGPVGASPALGSGRLYTASGSRLEAFAQGSGRPLWSATIGGSLRSSPAVAAGRVYVGSGDGVLHALDAATGAALWAVPTGAPIESSPSVANGLVYVGGGLSVHAFDAVTGERRWTAGVGGLVRSSAAVLNGRVYVGSDDGSLNVFGLADG